MVISVDPIAFHLGPLAVRWFGLCFIAAVGVAVALGTTFARRDAIRPVETLNLATWCIPTGLLGARLFHLLDNWEYYVTHPHEVGNLGGGGLALWGGIVVGGAVGWAVARWRRLPVRPLADSAALALLAGQVLGRVGCFLNGDGQGQPSDLPWGTTYTHPESLTPDFGVPRHPAQVYEGLLALALFLVLLALWRRRVRPGLVFALFLLGQGVGRSLIATVRLEAVFIAGLRETQIVGIAASLLALLLLARLARERDRTSPPSPA